MLLTGVALAQVDPDRVSAGSLGLLVMLLMGIATVLLVRGMNGRLKKLPKTFHREDDAAGEPPVTRNAGRER